MMDDVLLNQWSNLAGATGLTVLRPTGLMLQILVRLWNSGFGKMQFLQRKTRLLRLGETQKGTKVTEN
jgi:hypothetical protein